MLYAPHSDAFFTQEWMKPAVVPSLYDFDPIQRKALPGHPWLDIEIGGGMASAYNHRVNMASKDMPSLHLVDLGKGVNQLGYYMYHGGNNPLSTKFPLGLRDNPKYTLQESSFQPAGPRNSMPSISYDFFAALGEFSQARPHFHMMRRLHLSLSKNAWGDAIASTVNVNVDSNSSSSSENALRWTLRASGTKKTGFLFVNNYERLNTLPAHTNVRFLLEWNNSNTTLSIPSVSSDSLNISPGIWFVWPFNLELSYDPSSSSPILQYATAQLLTKVYIDKTEHTLSSSNTIFMVQSDENISPEMAIQLGPDAKILKHTGKLSLNGDIAVVNNIIPTLTTPCVVLQHQQNIIQIVVLPSSAKDQVWDGNFAGQHRVFFSKDFQLLFPDGNSLKLRNLQSKHTAKSVFIYPPPVKKMLYDDHHNMVFQEADGIFGKYVFDVEDLDIKSYYPTVNLIKNAGPARKIPLLNASGKPQEPTAEDWLGAEEYIVEINLPDNFNSSTTEVRLAIDYVGDAARIYFGNKLLTDNWYSGYVSNGRFEVGISYLADENPGLLKSGSKLQLLLLPIKEKSLQNIIYLQQRLWPNFNASNTALKLLSVEPIVLQRTSLKHV